MPAGARPGPGGRVQLGTCMRYISVHCIEVNSAVEGVSVDGGSGGWVGVGETNGEGVKTYKAMVRRVDTAGATMWTYRVGDSHKNSGTQVC